MESETIRVEGKIQSVNGECLLNNNTEDGRRESGEVESWCDKLYDIGVIGMIDPDEAVGNSYTTSPTATSNRSPSQERCKSPENFFQIKRLKRNDGSAGKADQRKEDMFDRLSDEIIVGIFLNVPKHVLATLSLVCKRFRRLCLDESLWPRFDLSFRTLPPCTLGYVLSRGVRALRLNSSAVTFPVFDPDQKFKHDYVFKLEYLDLSAVHISVKDLERLFSRCGNLKKLSVEACELSDEVCDYIARNRKLDTLDMAMCVGLSTEGLRSIVTSCNRLENVNISWCNLSPDALSTFCNNASPCLVSLNLAGSLRSLSNEDVEALVKRCPELTELDISDCNKLTGQVIECLIDGVENLQKLSISRSYKIGAANVLHLKNKASLCMLNMFGNSQGNMFASDVMKYLKVALPGVAINSEMMSPIARPTVGIRRTSIWQIRCRE